MAFDPHLPPEDPLRTPPLEPPFSPAGLTEGTGLPRNIAAALACIFLFLGGLIFYVLDRRDRFVRFYALQSIVLSGVFSLIGLAISISSGILRHIPWIGAFFVWMFSVMSGIAGVVFVMLWIALIWNAYCGKTFEMPFLWRIAKRHIPQALL